MGSLAEGTLPRWIDPTPESKLLGIVIARPGGEDQVIYLLMADHDGNMDVEVFVAREEAAGLNAGNLVRQSMEVVEEGDPELVALLRALGPNWWHISAHLDGQHGHEIDLECLLCAEDARQT